MAQFYVHMENVPLGSHRFPTPEGYLLCKDVPFARTGFQMYKASDIGLKGDHPVKVYRPYEEVFAPATLASFEGKTVTSPHPPVFLNPDNDASYYKGHVQNVRQGGKLEDGEFGIFADIMIKDSQLISRIESGSVEELSAGYLCEYVPDEHSPDVYYQRSIRGNHVAVVAKGRAGSAVKILDSQEETTVAEPNTATVTDDKVSVGALTGLLRLLGLGSAATTVDSESEAVERNRRVNEEAHRRAKVRNNDARRGKDEDHEEAEMEKEEKGAEKPKEAKDEDKPVSKKEMVDAIARAVKDAFESKEKEEKEKEAKDEEEKGKKKEESEDSDLIAVETLPAGERPVNPIPGADRALDCLRGIKSIVADSGDKAAIDMYNDAVRTIKGATKDAGKGYRELVGDRKRPEETNDITARRVTDGDNSVDFYETAKAFRGTTNIKGTAAELAAARKEKK